jgi:tRNA (mo5U34)-methyltransferase
MPETDVSEAETGRGRLSSLRRRVEARSWYHTIELAPDVVTPGWFDCRPLAPRILPTSCEGRRCLDVGTFDGFWAFEMERRGAAEVVAVDILDESRWDWPLATNPADREAIADRKGGGEGFLIAKEQLGSRVERIDRSVYELDPASEGTFDLVYLGSLLLHLRDPVRALERVRAVCGGALIVADAISLSLSVLVPAPVATLDGIGRPYWWKPNARALGRMLSISGFGIEVGPKRFRISPGPGFPRVPLRLPALATRQGREMLFTSRFGDPHAYAIARPR